MPNDVDWSSQLEKFSPVKNQGNCGSGYAFSASDALQMWWILKYPGRAPFTFSEQQFVDCSDSFGNRGCQGGWPFQAMNYNKAKGG